jgi:hypothetical protein
MLDFLRDRGLDRKLRLFAVACLRRVWHFFNFNGDRIRQAIVFGERMADETIGRSEWLRVHKLADDALLEAREMSWAAQGDLNRQTANVDRLKWLEIAAIDSQLILQDAWEAARSAPSLEPRDASCDEQQDQIILLRDIFGNPFRPVAFNPSWRTTDAVGVARAMYDARDFATMPILADALEDAGCDSADVLAHCRGDGPHVRGCWVVDLVLGKN